MKVLELFAGSRSIGKVAQRLGMEVFSTDIHPFDEIDLAIDIRKLSIDQLPFMPDVIWASPPCTSFSVASMYRHWKKENGQFMPKTDTALEGLKLVRRTLWLIRKLQKLNPKLVWFIENPRGALRKMPLVQSLPIRHTVTYCQYGDSRMKPTDIWTNSENWQPRPMCSPGSNCHESAPRGSHRGTQGMSNSFERSKVPENLCHDLLQSIIHQKRCCSGLAPAKSVQ